MAVKIVTSTGTYTVDIKGICQCQQPLCMMCNRLIGKKVQK